MAKDKLLRKAEDEMEFYKMTLINSEENYNKVFGSKPKVGSLNPLEAKQNNNVKFLLIARKSQLTKTR